MYRLNLRFPRNRWPFQNDPTIPTTALSSKFLPISQSTPGFRSVFYHHPQEFRQVVKFANTINSLYGLNLETFHDSHNHKGIFGVQERLVSSGIKAAFAGIRRGDPYSNQLELFSPSTNNWPQCLRLNPVLEFPYRTLWYTMYLYQVPYCDLYNKGYTSLGCARTTTPHPSLQRENGSFLPAFLLDADESERHARESNS